MAIQKYDDEIYPLVEKIIHKARRLGFGFVCETIWGKDSRATEAYIPEDLRAREKELAALRESD